MSQEDNSIRQHDMEAKLAAQAEEIRRLSDSVSRLAPATKITEPRRALQHAIGSPSAVARAQTGGDEDDLISLFAGQSEFVAPSVGAVPSEWGEGKGDEYDPLASLISSLVEGDDPIDDVGSSGIYDEVNDSRNQ